LVKLAKYEEAMQCYVKCNYNVLNIFVRLVTGSDIQKEIDERRQLLPYIDAALKNDDFFNSIKEQIKDNYDSYKNIYIRAMEIISLLYVDLNYEELVATYTNDDVAKKLLSEKKPLHLSLITKSNDPEEGQTLLDNFYERKASEKGKIIEEKFGVFAASFTFNHDHLNHFRLYGKSDKGIETGGVSIVVNEKLFKEMLRETGILSSLSSIIEENKTRKPSTVIDFIKYKQGGEDLKLPLFRCIYIDPETGFVASLGQREEYTFYRLKQDTKTLSLYQNKIQNILNEVRQQLNVLKTESKKLDPEIVSQLLLPLRYLVKNVSFKEEQECRIFIVKSLADKDVKVYGDTGKKYFDYLEINEYVNKVILGTNCKLKEDNNFISKCKNNGIKSIESSKWRFNQSA
jgi:hypothetical protein